MDGSRVAGTSAAVIGGGIGGLTAAIALARAGAAVTIFEQAPALEQVGAGIQITPNGARALEALGLGPALDAAGIRALALEPHDALTGRCLARFPLTGLDGPPYRFFHRADLVALLARAAAEAGAALRLGARVSDVSEDGQFLCGGERVAPDLTVGADGLHSVVRPVLNGADAPFFTGQVAWRTIVAATDAPPVARLWLAPGRHIVTYPLPGDRLNLVAVQERRDWTAEGWHHPADPADLRNAFHGLSGRVQGLMELVETARVWGLFRHPVAPRWQNGRLALLGDAAHPTLPFLAQGANLAVEDAYVLARALAEGPDRETALARYEAARRDRTARAIAAANANARTYHLAGPARLAAQLALMAAGRFAPAMFLKRYDWLYGHDVTA